MKNSQKTNEQLHQNVKRSLNLFINNLKDLLHNGNYQLKFVIRDSDTQEIESVAMEIDGHYFVLTKKKAKIDLYFDIEIKDLLNQKLIDIYDRVSIDNDIKIYTEKLKELKKKKAKLRKPEPKPEEDDDMVAS